MQSGKRLAIALAFLLAPQIVLAASDADWWTGFTAAPEGQGVSDAAFSQVSCFAEYNLELIAGGDFSDAGGVAVRKIASWNGNHWAPLGTGLNAAPTCFAVFNGSLIVGGYFTEAGGMPANHIARWDGEAWFPLGDGVNDFVKALVVIGGKLYVGGQFTTAGGVAAGRIARWDGAQWSNIGDFDSRVEALVLRNDRVVAGGLFTQVGALPVNRVAEWYNNAWHTLGSGTSGRVRALTVYQGALVAGGLFSSAGGAGASNIARWNGTIWSPLGSGVDGEVFALSPYRQALVAGGAFSHAGGGAAASIARWSGSAWSALGSGVDDDVQALRQDYTHLYVGGRFGSAGAMPASRIARWDDTPQSTHRLQVFPDGHGLYPTVQAAANAAVDGDTIEVAAGGYPDRLVIRGKWLLLRGDSGLEVTSLVRVDWSASETDYLEVARLHGFTLLEHSSVSGANSDIEVEVCLAQAGFTASGNGVNQAIRFVRCGLEGSSNLRYEGSASAIDLSGCECRDGSVVVLGEAGAKVLSSVFDQSNLTLYGGDYAELAGCRFTNGSGASVDGNPTVGGNLFVDAGGLTVERGDMIMDVRGNTLIRSGGITIEDGYGFATAIVTGNVLSRCEAGISVGGMDATVSENTILGCVGWGITALASPLTLTRNLAVHNDGGISLLGNPGVELVACNDVWSNPGGNWLGIADPTGTDGNITADPLFCNVTFDDLRLAEDSPCAPSVECARIGALDVGCGLSVSVDSPIEGARSFFAPVPLRVGALLSWSSSRLEGCGLDVFSLSGRRVATLVRGEMGVGRREIRWTGIDDRGEPLPSGVYFFRLRVGESVQSRKLLFLR